MLGKEDLNHLSLDDLKDLEELRTNLVDKLVVMAERMNLGKLTLHTAISYLDRLVLLMSQDKHSKPAPAGPSSISASKVITPRQRVMNFNKGTSNSGSDSNRLQMSS